MRGPRVVRGAATVIPEEADGKQAFAEASRGFQWEELPAEKGTVKKMGGGVGDAVCGELEL